MRFWHSRLVKRSVSGSVLSTSVFHFCLIASWRLLLPRRPRSRTNEKHFFPIQRRQFQSNRGKAKTIAGWRHGQEKAKAAAFPLPKRPSDCSSRRPRVIPWSSEPIWRQRKPRGFFVHNRKRTCRRWSTNEDETKRGSDGTARTYVHASK